MNAKREINTRFMLVYLRQSVNMKPSTDSTKRQRRDDPQKIATHPLVLHYLESFNEFEDQEAEASPSPGAESQDEYFQVGTDLAN